MGNIAKTTVTTCSEVLVLLGLLEEFFLASKLGVETMMLAVMQSLFTVTVCFCWMIWMVTRTSIFENVVVELGFEHYAEPAVMYGGVNFMPVNAIVNILYVIIGVCWLRFPLRRQQNKLTNDHDVRKMVTVMAWMGILYGPVQSWRIVCQTRPSAVLDQWCTFPFFMWVVVWCKSIDCKANIGASQYVPLMILSICSYFASVFFVYGFEVVLALHIVVVLYYASRVQRLYGNLETKVTFAKALLCCCGFVVIKVLDLNLGKWALFQRFSGHFWSKVCDALQLHYVCKFLTELALRRREITAESMKYTPNPSEK